MIDVGFKALRAHPVTTWPVI